MGHPPPLPSDGEADTTPLADEEWEEEEDNSAAAAARDASVSFRWLRSRVVWSFPNGLPSELQPRT